MKHHVETSKVIVFLSLMIFICTIGVGMFLGIKYENLDTTVLITAISASGGIAGSSVIFYYRKAQNDNSFKIRMMLYKESSNTRLRFNREMLKLREKYNITKEEMAQIEEDSDIDEMMESALNGTVNFVDSYQQDSEREVDIPN